MLSSIWFLRIAFLIQFAVLYVYMSSRPKSEGVIVTLHEGWKYTPFPFLTVNKTQFAITNGYEFFNKSPKHFSTSEHPTWKKPRMILNAMKQYSRSDFLLWIDGDALFATNESIQHRFKEFFKSDYEILIASDWNGLNAGMILMKNTTWVKEFWKKVESSPHNKIFHEQSIIFISLSI